MTTYNTVAYKTVGAGFAGERCTAKLTYDFASDLGAYSGNTWRLGVAGRKICIVEAVVHVETAVVGSSSTISMGTTSAATVFLSAVAEATLVDDYVVDTAGAQAEVVAAGDYFTMTIGTANLTAGKINLFLSYYNID
jgi:hypothetical protein